MRWWILALAACSGKDGKDPATPTVGEPSGCDPLVPEVCAMPWPSGLFEAVDATTPTGRRLSFGPETLPKNRDNVQIAPDMFTTKDGYSTMTPLLAWFDGATIEGVIPHTNLDAYLATDAKTVIIDTVTHERVPHWVELDSSAEDPAQASFMFRPAVPLEHARRYVVGIRNVVKADGTPVAVSEAFAALRDDTATTDADVETRRDLFDDVVFPELEGQGFARDDLQLAWEFGTISRDNSLGPTLAIRDDALARIGSSPPYTIDLVEDEDCATEGVHVMRTVYGHFTSPRYTDLDAPGAKLVRDENGLPIYQGDTEVDFMVRIPCSVALDPQSGARVLQYGHGLLGDFSEARTSYLTELIDTNRWVLIAQDWTGMATLDAGFITLMLALDPSDFSAIPDRTTQGFTEWTVALRLARGALVDDPNFAFGGLKVIDPSLDPVFYGNSQGAILGGAYFLQSPDLTKAVLGVGGMPYSLLLSRSSDFGPFFLLFQEKFPDARDIAVTLAAFQTIWDPGESGGYASALLDPLPGTPPKQILMQVGIGDAQVTTLGAQLAARAWGASTVTTAVRDVWGVEEEAAPFTGSALVEWLYTDGSTEPIENLPPDHAGDTHECPRREVAAQQQLRDFLETGVVQQYCVGPCTGTRAGLCD